MEGTQLDKKTGHLSEKLLRSFRKTFDPGASTSHQFGGLRRLLAEITDGIKRLVGGVYYDIHTRRTYGQTYGRYGLPTLNILDLLPGLDETIDPYTFLYGSAQPLDIALLRALAARYDTCRYLEIGCLRGESLANVAEIADECVSLSLSEHEMRHLGYSDEIITNDHLFSRNLPNVQCIGHESQTFDFSSFDNGFDLIFIDGDHTYEGIKTDTQNAFRVLRDKKSVIVWHDYKDVYQRITKSVLAAILDGCPEAKRSNIYHVSNTLCAIYTDEEFETMLKTSPFVPTDVFSMRVTARKM